MPVLCSIEYIARMCLNMRPEKLRAKYYDLAQLTRIIRGFGMYGEGRTYYRVLLCPALLIILTLTMRPQKSP